MKKGTDLSRKKRVKNHRSIMFTYDVHDMSPNGLKYEVSAFSRYLFVPVIIGS